MAFVDLGAIAAANADKSANQTTRAIVIQPGSSAAAGDLVVFTICVDNSATVDGDEGAVSGVTDGVGGNTWVKAKEHCNSRGASQGGVTVSVWYSKLTNALPAVTVVTATFTNTTARDASTGTLQKFSVSGTVSVEASSGRSDTAITSSPALNVTTANIECLRFVCRALEINASGSAAVAGWTSYPGAATTGGSGVTNVGSSLWVNISTGTGFNWPATATGVSTDSAIVYVAFKETAGGPTIVEADGTAAGTGAAAGVSGAIKGTDGTSAGTSTATGQGAAVKGTDGTSAGTSTATGQGAGVQPGTGTAAGSSIVAGVPGAIVADSGTAAGTSAATGPGASVKGADGTSAGTGAATGQAGAVAGTDGTSAGAATVAGAAAGVQQGTGTAAGAATVAGEGADVAVGGGAEGTAAGSSTVAGVSGAIQSTGGAAAGVGTVAGQGATIKAGDGTAAGVGGATGGAAAVHQGDGTSAGTGATAGDAATIAAVTGTAAGVGTASGQAIDASSGAYDPRRMMAVF